MFVLLVFLTSYVKKTCDTLICFNI